MSKLRAVPPSGSTPPAPERVSGEMSSIDEILTELRRGRMVVIMDDEERENEGDLLMAAECVRPEDINFMARFGRGLICLTLTRERCAQLRLPLMVNGPQPAMRTNFTVSIEAAEGVTIGRTPCMPPCAPMPNPRICGSRVTCFRSWRSRAAF